MRSDYRKQGPGDWQVSGWRNPAKMIQSGENSCDFVPAIARDDCRQFPTAGERTEPAVLSGTGAKSRIVLMKEDPV